MILNTARDYAFENEAIVHIADTLLRISSYSAPQLDQYIRSGNYVISAKTAKLDYILPKLPKGWQWRYIRNATSDPHYALVILPTDKLHQRLWNEGINEIGRRAGLIYQPALLAWAKWQSIAKFDYLPILVNMLHDSELAAKYLEYDKNWKFPQFSEWRSRTGITDNLKSRQRADMIDLYKHIASQVNCLPLKSPRKGPSGQSRTGSQQ